MNTFTKQAAQGDLLITAVDSLPDGLSEVEPENGSHIVAHSETGHHHVVAANAARAYQGSNPMVMFLVVTKPTALEHHRSFDTHEPLELKSGTYEIRRQREYTPEGWRRVAD